MIKAYNFYAKIQQIFFGKASEKLAHLSVFAKSVVEIYACFLRLVISGFFF